MSVALSVPSEIFLALPVVDSPARGLAFSESVEAQTGIRNGILKFSDRNTRPTNPHVALSQ
jgi:hypothetical protein